MHKNRQTCNATLVQWRETEEEGKETGYGTLARIGHSTRPTHSNRQTTMGQDSQADTILIVEFRIHRFWVIQFNSFICFDRFVERQSKKSILVSTQHMSGFGCGAAVS